MAVFHEMHRDKDKRAEPFTSQEFLPEFLREADEGQEPAPPRSSTAVQSPEEMSAVLRALRMGHEAIAAKRPRKSERGPGRVIGGARQP